MLKTEAKNSTICAYLTQLRSKYGKLSVLFVVLAVLVSVTGLSGIYTFTRGRADAATSSTLNFQGRLLDASGNVVADGTYNIQFNLYTVSSGGSTQWTESYLNNATQGVTLKYGYFSVQLGSLTSFPSTINWDQEQWLGMTVRGTGSCAFGSCTPTDSEMTPRFKLTAVPYAFKSAVAANVASNDTNAASTNSNNVTITSGNAAGSTSNSGNITIDTGTATGTTGTITLGASNASALTLGRSGLATAIQGSLTVAEAASLNGDVTLGNALTDLITISGTIQGTNALVFEGATADGFETTIAVVDPTADVTLQIPALAAGTYDFCTSSGNCLGNGDILQGGNTYGTTVTIGTNDGFDLALETSNTTRLTVNATTGNVTLTSDLAVNGGDITSTGDLTVTPAGGDVNIVGNLSVSAGSFLSLAGGNTASRPGSPTEGMVYYDTTTKQLLVYANGKWQADRSTATKIVAASNSSQAIKDSADYVADGTADEVEINAALTAASGGKVYLAEGTYVAAATILIPNNTTLAGAGRGTLIELGNLDVSENLIENSDTTTGTGVSIQDMRLDGRDDLNTAGTQYGIYFSAMGGGSGSSARQGSRIKNVEIKDFRTYGIYLSSSNNNQLLGNTITGIAGGTGIILSSSSNNTVTENILQRASIFLGTSSNYNTINDNFVQDSLGQGIYLLSVSYNNVSGNTIQSIVNNGILIFTSTHNTISANNIKDAANGISIESTSTNNNVSGNSLQNNTTSGVNISSSSNNSVSTNVIADNGGGANNDGILLSAADTNTVSYNTITDTSCGTTCYAINISNSTSDKNYLSGNRFIGSASNSASINDAGTNTIYQNQQTNSTTSANSDVSDIRFRGSTNSTTAFAVQNAAGASILNIDTTNGEVEVGDSSTAGKLVISDGSSNTGTILVNATAGNYTFTIPTVTANDTFCLVTLANCAAATATLQNVYDADVDGSDAVITLTAADGAVVVRDAASTVGNLFVVEANGGADYLAVSSTAITLGLDTTLGAGKYLAVTGGNTASRPGTPSEGMIYYDTSTKQLITYSNGKWQSDRNSSTKIVAASNASQAAKDGADYVTDGENSTGSGTGTIDGDQIEINSALTAVSALGGGTVYLTEGTFTIDASISIPNNVTLAGAGAGTLVQLGNFGATSTTIDAIVNTDTSASSNKIIIQDLKLDGRRSINTAGAQQGIALNGMGGGTGATARQGATVKDVWITNFNDDPIYMTNSDNGLFQNMTITGNGGSIFVATGSDYNKISDSILQGNAAAPVININLATYTSVADNLIQNGTHGIHINNTTSYTTITGNTITGNSTYGINMVTSANYATINNNTITSNSRGISIDSSSYINVTGNYLAGNTSKGIYITTSANNNIVSGNKIHDSGGATANDGIHIFQSDNNQIVGNSISDASCSTTCRAIFVENAASDDNVVSDNYYTGASAANPAVISNSGTRTIFAGQYNTAKTFSVTSTVITARSTSVLTGSIDPIASTTVTGVSTEFTTELVVGDRITVSGETRTVVAIASDTSLTVDTAFSDNANDTSVDRLPSALRVTDSSGVGIFLLNDIGQAQFRNSTDSTSGFAIQNAAGTNIVNVDTSTPGVSITGTLSVSSTSTFTGLGTFNGGLTVATGQNFTVNGDAFTDLTGTGLTISSGALTVDTTYLNTNYIQNQNASDQTGNIRISGTARANTSVLTPALDVAAAGTLSLGATTATAITLGQAGVTTTNAGALTVSQLLTGSLGATISGANTSINASSNFDTNINTGTSTGNVNIGNSASTTNIAGATNINTSGTTNTTIGNSGSTTAITGVTNINTSGTATTTIGNATGAISLQGGVTLSANFSQTGSTTFSTGTGAVSLNGAVTAGSTLAVTTLGSADTSTFLCRNSSNQIASCSSTPLTNALTDNIADAFDLQEGTNNYININTTNGSENISFGNATTNPTFNFLGSGLLSVAGSVDVGINLTVNNDLNVTGLTTLAGGLIVSDPSTPAYVGDTFGSTVINGGIIFGNNTPSSVGSEALTGGVVSEDPTSTPGDYTGANLYAQIYGNTNAQDYSGSTATAIKATSSLNAASTTVLNLVGVEANAGIVGGAGSTVNNAIGLRANNAILNAGTITNNYGLYVENQTSGTNDYGIYVAGADTYALFVDAGATRLDGTLEVGTLGATNTSSFLCRNSSNQLAGCSSTPLTNSLTDNIVDAFDLQEGSNNYININTTNGSENISFGNATTNPSYNFLGSGTLSVAGATTSTGLITGNAGLTISGGAISLNASSNNNTSINTGTSTGTVTIGNSAAGALTLSSGSTVSVTSGTTNAISIDSGTTGAVNIGTGASAKTVTIGSTTGAAITNIQAGTGTAAGDLNLTTTAGGIINIGGNAVNNKVLNLGSTGTTNAASTINIATTNANQTQSVSIGNTTSANNVILIQGGTSSTAIRLAAGSGGTITVGSQTAANTVSLGTVGTAAFSSTVNIATSTGAAQTVNIGSTSSTSSVTIDSGTGAISIGTGAQARTTNIATGGAVQTVTLGSTNTTSATTIAAGSGAITFNASQAQFSEVTGTRTLTVQTRTTNVAGSALTISGGTAGSGAAAFTGGTLTLQGGNAGGTGNANGANVVITGGTGVGTGVRGLVVMDTATYSAATVQNFTANANITQANVDTYGSILISGNAAGWVATLPDPTITTTGRVIYITNSGSFDITLAANTVGVALSITLKPASTATMYWNGTDWTAAGASSSTDLQAAYNNTATSAGGAELVLNASGGAADGLTVRNNATTPIIGGIFEAQTSVGSNIFSVNNNAAEYAVNGGAETSTNYSTNWLAAPAGGTVTRNTSNPSSTVATGVASTSVVTTATAAHGARNLLSSALTYNLKYNVSYTVRADSASAGFTTLETMYSSDGSATAGNVRACVAGTPTYSTGTASQSTTTITGVGTTWTAAMVGQIFVFANGASALITGYTSATSLSTSASYSQTVASQTYNMYNAGNTVNAGAWSRVTCTFTAPSSGTLTNNSIFIRQTDATARTFYIDNLSVTVSADANHAVDGSVDDSTNFATNWTAAPAGGTVTRTTSTLYDTSASAQVVTTATAGHGMRNNLTITPSVSTQYLVTFYAKSSNTFNDIRVRYSRDGGTNFVSCGDYNTQSVSTTGFTRITCLLTTDGTTATNPDLMIEQTAGTARTFYVDALTMTLNTNNSNNVQIGAGSKGGPITLFTLDRAGTAPIAANNDAYLGSMYYDTTTGRIQCYEADGWGACGSAPDNYVNLNPEYAGAVLNGSGVGTMTADFCANQSGVLQVNTTLCATGESRNFYKWTSPQASDQTYSIYVSYQLPATFKGFASDDTVQLTGRTDSTTNGSVSYEMFKSESGALTACGTSTTVTSSNNTWQTVGINGNEATSCSFTTSSANAFVIFKINVTAKSNANVYVGTLSFTTTGR